MKEKTAQQIKDKKFGWMKDRNDYHLIKIRAHSCRTYEKVTLYYLAKEEEATEAEFRTHDYDDGTFFRFSSSAKTRIVSQSGRRHLLVEDVERGSKNIKVRHTTFGKQHLTTGYWAYAIEILD